MGRKKDDKEIGEERDEEEETKERLRALGYID